ncbi:hypothetical protein J6590_001061 [Homalodisca vitripennis]|nr:hypothetical protein J6590_001061 [Homalodisca vitripennis]
MTIQRARRKAVRSENKPGVASCYSDCLQHDMLQHGGNHIECRCRNLSLIQSRDSRPSKRGAASHVNIDKLAQRVRNDASLSNQPQTSKSINNSIFSTFVKKYDLTQVSIQKRMDLRSKIYLFSTDTLWSGLSPMKSLFHALISVSVHQCRGITSHSLYTPLTYATSLTQLGKELGDYRLILEEGGLSTIPPLYQRLGEEGIALPT